MAVATMSTTNSDSALSCVQVIGVHKTGYIFPVNLFVQKVQEELGKHNANEAEDLVGVLQEAKSKGNEAYIMLNSEVRIPWGNGILCVVVFGDNCHYPLHLIQCIIV